MNARKFVKSSFSRPSRSESTTFFSPYSFFIKVLWFSDTAKTRSRNGLTDCHIGGTDGQKVFSDSPFSWGENWKSSGL